MMDGTAKLVFLVHYDKKKADPGDMRSMLGELMDIAFATSAGRDLLVKYWSPEVDGPYLAREEE